MSNALIAVFVAFALTASLAAPISAAEYRNSAGQKGAAQAQLRSTPDIGNSNGDVNTDPAMTGTGTSRPATTDGNSCRTGGGQSYPNANTDNPPGLQPCPL